MVKAFYQEWDVIFDMVKNRSQKETVRTGVKNREKYTSDNYFCILL